jgi:hypothetical protein
VHVVVIALTLLPDWKPRDTVSVAMPIYSFTPAKEASGQELSVNPRFYAIRVKTSEEENIFVGCCDDVGYSLKTMASLGASSSCASTWVTVSF